MSRFCAFDDVEVRAVADADSDTKKKFGQGTTASGYYHLAGKVASCGRRFLTEDQTYTEGESDLNPPDQET